MHLTVPGRLDGIPADRLPLYYQGSRAAPWFRFGCWHELVLYVAAHEAAHIAHYRRGRLDHTESDADHHAARHLAACGRPLAVPGPPARCGRRRAAMAWPRPPRHRPNAGRGRPAAERLHHKEAPILQHKPCHGAPAPTDGRYTLEVYQTSPAGLTAAAIGLPAAVGERPVFTCTLPAPDRVDDDETVETRLCEQMWTLGNADPQDLDDPAERRLAAAWRAAGLRSLSVGDEVLLRHPDGATTDRYACAGAGWTHLAHNGQPAAAPDQEGW